MTSSRDPVCQESSKNRWPYAPDLCGYTLHSFSSPKILLSTAALLSGLTVTTWSLVQPSVVQWSAVVPRIRHLPNRRRTTHAGRRPPPPAWPTWLTVLEVACAEKGEIERARLGDPQATRMTAAEPVRDHRLPTYAHAARWCARRDLSRSSDEFAKQSRGAQRAPLTSRVAPVTYEAAGESSQRIGSAISSGCASRCIGMVGRSRSSRPVSPVAACISVRTRPGRTPFTRMPSAATSRARP